MQTNAYLSVGDTGIGGLTIGSGALVKSASSVVLGGTTGSVGQINIDGANSKLQANDFISVGYLGQGTLHVSGGAAVTAAGAGGAGNGEIDIGGNANTVGNATVDGVGSSISVATFAVGNVGNGTLAVTGGGTVTSTNMFFGGNPNGVGNATVDGAGSNLQATVGMFIGNANLSQGTLTVTGGATLIVPTSPSGIPPAASAH